MSQEVAKKVDTAIDGFDGFEDRVEGAEGSSQRIVQGEKWKFTGDCKWVNGSDEPISSERVVAVVDICRVVLKRVDGQIMEKKWLAPLELIPDLAKLNEKCPKSEWGEDFNGNPKGPYQLLYVVYMVDMNTMKKITYLTDTVGGGMCVRELADQVANKRKFYGTKAYPMVSPSKRWMNTHWKGRDRPCLEVKNWIVFGPDGTALPEASPPPTLPPAAPPAQPETKDVPKGARIVSPEAANAEEMDDDIPF
jgi:hypothetical protein